MRGNVSCNLAVLVGNFGAGEGISRRGVWGGVFSTVCAAGDGFSGTVGAGTGKGWGDGANLGVLGGDGGAKGAEGAEWRVGVAGGAGDAGGDISVDFFVWCASMCLCNWLFEENLSGHRLHSWGCWKRNSACIWLIWAKNFCLAFVARCFSRCCLRSCSCCRLIWISCIVGICKGVDNCWLRRAIIAVTFSSNDAIVRADHLCLIPAYLACVW